MDQNQFIKICKLKTMHYINEHFNIEATPKEYKVFVSWSSKALQNNKALLGSTADDDYFEFTYDGDENQLYMNVYSKTENKVYEL